MHQPKLSQAQKQQRKAHIQRNIDIYHQLHALSCLGADECLVVILKGKRKKAEQTSKPNFPRSFRVKSKVDRALCSASRIKRALDPLRNPFIHT
ncbi:hypothetical protein ACS86_17850 [Vibrio alginolyticus]|nr:hypothetical protein ACS86_17850 [Vibrio alginolyticus]